MRISGVTFAAAALLLLFAWGFWTVYTAVAA